MRSVRKGCLCRAEQIAGSCFLEYSVSTWILSFRLHSLRRSLEVK